MAFRLLNFPSLGAGSRETKREGGAGSQETRRCFDPRRTWSLVLPVFLFRVSGFPAPNIGAICRKHPRRSTPGFPASEFPTWEQEARKPGVLRSWRTSPLDESFSSSGFQGFLLKSPASVPAPGFSRHFYGLRTTFPLPSDGVDRNTRVCSREGFLSVPASLRCSASPVVSRLSPSR